MLRESIRTVMRNGHHYAKHADAAQTAGRLLEAERWNALAIGCFTRAERYSQQLGEEMAA